MVMKIKDGEDDPTLDMVPPEQEMMDIAGDDMAGMAEGNEAETTPADTALADVVPDANPDLEGRMAALEAQLASAKAAAEEAPPPATTAAPAAGMPEDSEWAAFEADYPDIAGPIKRLLEARTQRYGTDMQGVHTRIFEEAMDAARPDWRDLRDDPAFGTWMQANPDQQQAAQVPGVRAALKVLSAYDASQKGKDIAGQRANRLKSAEATPAKGGRAPSLSDSLEGWAAE